MRSDLHNTRTTRLWTSRTTWFWNSAREPFAKTPTRLQTAALDIQLMPCENQSRINWLVASASTYSTIRKRHKLQRHICLSNLCYQVRTQQLQHSLGLSGHSHPRVAAIDLFGRFSGLKHVILKRSLLNDRPKVLNCVFAAHSDFHSQSVRRIHNVSPFGRTHITNRNAAFTIKQSGGPRN